MYFMLSATTFQHAFHNQWLFFAVVFSAPTHRACVCMGIVVWLYPFVNRSLVIFWFYVSCSVNDDFILFLQSMLLLLLLLPLLLLSFFHFASHFFLSLTLFVHNFTLNTTKPSHVRVNCEKSKNMKG